MLLVGILICAALVRLAGLGEQEFWLDELHSLLNSAAHRADFEALPYGQILHDVPRYTDLDADSTLPAVWRGMRGDSHPPLYFVLLRVWRGLAGDGEFLTRLPSALLSVLAIVPVALLLRELGRAGAALGAAGLLALSFSHIQMAQQARPYSLAMLFVSTGWWLLIVMEVRWVGFTSRQRISVVAAYGAMLLLAMLTHYFAGLALLGQAAYAGLRFRGRLLSWWLGGTLTAAALFCVIWLPSFLAQLDFIRSQDWVKDPSDRHVMRTIVRTADLPVRLVFAHPLPKWDEARVYIQTAIGVGLLVAATIILRRKRCGDAALFAFWFGVPAAALCMIDLVTGKELLTHLRYSSLAAPGITGLLVLAVAGLNRRLVVGVVVAAALGMGFTLELPTTHNPPSRRAALALERFGQPGDLIVFERAGMEPDWPRRVFTLVSYYHTRPADAILLLGDESPAPEVLAQMRKFPRIFSVTPTPPGLNRTPQTHEFRRNDRYGFIADIGFIYWFHLKSRATSQPNR